jgi:ATP-binding cassette subfamily B protein
MGRINNIFRIKPDITSPKKPLPLKPLKGSISFNHIFFRYELSKNTSRLIRANFTDFKDTYPRSNKNNWLLKDISFDIKAGMNVGIVGFTGSGKSTIASLIPRLYDPQRGKILIDGYDIKSYPLEILRSNIGYVTQEPFLFSKSIKENILFGKEELLSNLDEIETMYKITEVSKISHLHEDVIRFPKKYETLIGERGVTLSGGQKQRLAIARALLSKPRILIFDDSFSNVDTNTEELILGDLREKIKGITTIIISHRISTIRDSDLIIVIDEGKINTIGKHSSLMEKSEIYQSLYHRQQLSEELKEEV